MRVGVFIGNNNPQSGGVFTFEDNIISAMLKVKSVHEFYFFYYGDGKDKGGPANFISLSKPRRIFRSVCGHLLKTEVFTSSLQKAAAKYNIELMWFVYPYEPVNIPFVFTVLDLEHRIHPFFPEISITGNTWDAREKYYGSILHKASYVITGTEAGKKEIVKFYQVRHERIKVIPFPTPTFALEQREIKVNIKEKYNLSLPYLFYPAQFWPHKNHVTLLYALKALKEKYSLDFNLVFTGSDKGNLKYVRDKSCDLGLAEKVHFLGYVPIDDLVGLYRNAFAMVYITFFGPDNIPPLEAFGLKCPVVASKVSGAEEQLGEAAMLVEPHNEEEIALAIKRLHEDSDLRDTLIKRGFQRAAEWTSEDYARGIIATIDDFELYRRSWSSKEVYRHL